LRNTQRIGYAAIAATSRESECAADEVGCANRSHGSTLSTTTRDPPVPSESRLTLLDPLGTGIREKPVVQQALTGLGRLVATLRGQLQRVRGG
jgi:hypothetical protein